MSGNTWPHRAVLIRHAAGRVGRPVARWAAYVFEARRTMALKVPDAAMVLLHCVPLAPRAPKQSRVGSALSQLRPHSLQIARLTDVGPTFPCLVFGNIISQREARAVCTHRDCLRPTRCACGERPHGTYVRTVLYRFAFEATRELCETNVARGWRAS
jgi:hypothetical protein